MGSKECAERLLERLSVSTCSFTTVDHAKKTLAQDGFAELFLCDEKWNLSPGEKYFICVNDSTLYAFCVGGRFEAKTCARNNAMLRLVAAHTDHPCLYVKSQPEMRKSGYKKLNVEVYGGPILNTWLDRPLSATGRVVLRSKTAFEPEVRIFDYNKPIFTIPNLAIHLNRDVNKGVELNRQIDMAPIAGLADEEDGEAFFVEMLANKLKVDAGDILDYEVYLYQCEKGDVLGVHEEFLSSPRLDNITSVEACLQGIRQCHRSDGIDVIALYDNEEIGSRTRQGADSVLFSTILEKIFVSLGATEGAAKTAIANGFALSLDVAHGFHPNHPEKSDPTNENPLGGGVVIKRASAQNYVTDSAAIGTVMMLMEQEKIPYQKYAGRSDVTQGGTLGTIASKYLPIRMVDMGVPVLAMHSARELMAIRDQVALEQLVQAFFNAE